MTQPIVAVLLEDTQLTLDDIAISCAVSREWVIEHVHAGVLLANPGAVPEQWRFSGYDLQRTRRICDLEKRFEANPELAGLVADLIEELDRLRARLRRAGLRDL